MLFEVYRHAYYSVNVEQNDFEFSLFVQTHWIFFRCLPQCFCMTHTCAGGWGDIFGSGPDGPASGAAGTGDSQLQDLLKNLPDLSFMLRDSICPPDGAL